MLLKLFVLGLPGSGKSAIARSIVDYVDHKRVNGWNNQQWSAIRFNDYAILLDMFRQDTERKRFKAAIPGGFDVLDLEVFDDALKVFEQVLNAYMNSLKSDEKKLIIVEFSRDNYQHAFHVLSKKFLGDSYFIHLDVDVVVCKQRISDRAADIAYENDYHVSEYIFETYYHSDDGKYLADILEQDFEIGKRRVLAIDNNLSLELAVERITRFIDFIFDSVPASESDVQPGCH